MSLPSGRSIRDRGPRRARLEGAHSEFGNYLLAERPPPVACESHWTRWPDHRLPVDRSDPEGVVREASRRSVSERVETACAGGRARTGTALACVAVLDGVPAAEAVAYVRGRYDPRAVRFPGSAATSGASHALRRPSSRSACGLHVGSNRTA